MAKELKKIYIDDISKQTQEMLERASKKHKSINAYCIFVEGDHYHALTPAYESEKERVRETRKLMNILIERPDICDKFAEFVMAPARYHEREAKKQTVAADKELGVKINIAYATMPETERQRYAEEWLNAGFEFNGTKYNTLRAYILARLCAELKSAKAEQGA